MPVQMNQAPVQFRQTMVAPMPAVPSVLPQPKAVYRMPEYRTMADKDSTEVGAYLKRAVVPEMD